MSDPLMIKVLRGEWSERIPLWYMRQAGRYLPEYNEIRKGMTFIELCSNPKLATEVSIQPHKRFGLDAIIMFSDILTPVHAAGIPLHFEEKKGPVLEQTIEKESDISHLDGFNPDTQTAYVGEILQRITGYIGNLPVETERPALIGFAGSPFTLASYLVEGGTSRKFEKTKAKAFGETGFFKLLLEKITEITIDYLKYQIRNGAQIVQIFDSWGGILKAEDYMEFSGRYTQKILDALREEPAVRILFTGNGSHLIREMAGQKPDAISLDWRVNADVLRIVPESIGLQGNLDPLNLYGTPDRVIMETARVLHRFGHRDRYVFNLGHGIHPKSPVECVEAMIETVRQFKKPRPQSGA